MQNCITESGSKDSKQQKEAHMPETTCKNCGTVSYGWGEKCPRCDVSDFDEETAPEIPSTNNPTCTKPRPNHLYGACLKNYRTSR